MKRITLSLVLTVTALVFVVTSALSAQEQTSAPSTGTKTSTSTAGAKEQAAAPAAGTKATTSSTAKKATKHKKTKAAKKTAAPAPAAAKEPAPAPAAGTQGQAAPAQAQGEHTVIKGDTLWDISGKYMTDPFLWPEIWKANPGIENPNLIYPGEKVRLPGMPAEAETKAPQPQAVKPAAPAEGAAGAKAAKEKTPFEEESLVDISKTLLVIPEKKENKVISLNEVRQAKIPVATEGAILEAGFIAADLDHPSSIAGSPEGDLDLYGNEDKVLVFPIQGAKPGDLLISFRPELGIVHPVTCKEMGTLVKTTGMLRVLGESDGYLLCRVEEISNDVRKNDLVLPYTLPELVYDPVEKNPQLRGEWGYVVAGLDNKKLNGQMYTVYIDLGSDDGVKPGDTFEVRRSGGEARPAVIDVPRDNERLYIIADIKSDFKDVERPEAQPLPDVIVGDVQVISVRKHTAAAKVVSFSEPVRPGYRIYYKD